MKSKNNNKEKEKEKEREWIRENKLPESMIYRPYLLSIYLSIYLIYR